MEGGGGVLLGSLEFFGRYLGLLGFGFFWRFFFEFFEVFWGFGVLVFWRRGFGVLGSRCRGVIRGGYDRRVIGQPVTPLSYRSSRASSGLDVCGSLMGLVLGGNLGPDEPESEDEGLNQGLGWGV